MRITSIRSSGLHRSCPSCAGRLEYDVAAKMLRCQSCDELTSLSLYDAQAETAASDEMEVVEYTCPQCGAAVHTTETNLISYCSFCGSDVIFTQRLRQTRRPRWIQPFRISREKCAEIYAKHVTSAPYAPADAKETRAASLFQPIYVPFYYYTEAHSGVGKANYVQTETDSDYIHTYTYGVDTQGAITVRGEVQCACSQFDPEVAERLQFSTDGMVAFSPGYLCGFFAEAPDMLSNKEYSDLEEYTERQYARVISKETKETITTVALPPKVQDDADLVLLPVWLLAQPSGERVLYTAINGMDGTIICDTPVAPRRTYWLALKLGLVFAALLLLLSSVVILRGQLVAGLCALLSSAGYFYISRTLQEHATRETQLKEQRHLKRCRLLKSSGIQKALLESVQRTSDRSDFGSALLHEIPLLLATAFVLFFGVFALYYLVDATELTLLIPFVMVGGFLLFIWYTTFRRTREDRSISNPFTEWFLLYFLKAFLAAVICYVLSEMNGNRNAAIAGLVSDRGWLAPYLCGFSLLMMFISFPGTGCSRGHLLAYAAELLLVAVTGASMFTVHDQRVYYLAAIAIMLTLIFSMNLLTRQHNDFVTRPVPFFGRKEEAE